MPSCSKMKHTKRQVSTPNVFHIQFWSKCDYLQKLIMNSGIDRHFQKLFKNAAVSITSSEGRLADHILKYISLKNCGHIGIIKIIGLFSYSFWKNTMFKHSSLKISDNPVQVFSLLTKISSHRSDTDFVNRIWD